MRKKVLLLFLIFGTFLTMCFGFLTPKNLNVAYAKSVNGNLTDTYSFNSGCESASAYYQNTYGVQGENILISANCIKLKYDNKTTSTNGYNIYEAVKSISVTTNSLPGWGNGWFDGHNLQSATLYCHIYQDGSYMESLSVNLPAGSTATIDLSGINNKYSYYTFQISYRYLISWFSIWGANGGHKYIAYDTGNFFVQTKNPSAYLQKIVYDTKNKCYTDTIKPDGNYKSDNKDTYFRWGYVNYDNTNDTVNVLGSVHYSNGTVIPGYEAIRDGVNGFYLGNLNDGTYILKIRTELGITYNYNITFDKFAPLLSIESGVRIDSGVYCIEYNSKISWTDTASVKNVKINNNTITNGQTIYPGVLGIDWNIEYDIIVTRTTEATETYTVVFTNKEQVDLNANQDSFTKSPIARWYETYLEDTEEKIYHSWASYENALNFAIERENNTVSIAYYDGGTWIAGIGMDDPINKKTGNFYIYKQRDNASEMNAYFSKESLDTAILKYAQDSITNNTYYSKSTPATPHNEEKIFKTKVVNDVEYNYFLLGSFTITKRPYVTLWINNVKQNFGLENSITISTAGSYKIEEENPFGDKSIYFIHIQKSAPEIEYTMKGSSLQRTLTAENTRFGTYFDLTLFDIDDDSLLIIEKSGIGSVAKVYTYSELLSILNKSKIVGNEYLFDLSGQYTVTSVNHWTAFAHIPVKSYTFYVSVNEPYINEPSVNREKNELTLSFGIPVGEYNTQITSVVIRKYNENTEEWLLLTQDSKGTSISTDCYEYIFNTKGYYLIQITDNFARTYEREYAFSREKPNAILTVGTQNAELGEDEQGYYNKKVTITWYDNTISAKMYGVSYTWHDGLMVKQNLNAVEYENGSAITSEGYYIIELMDIDYNSRRFTFFIDQKAPELVIKSGENIISTGSFKNTDITAEFDEASEYETPITASVKRNTFPIMFPDNGIFTEEGEYEIILLDGSGNSNTYYFTIDKTAPVGELYLEDGSEFAVNGITNKKVYCSWGETGITATCNEDVYYKGSLLSSNNTYRIVLTDKAGNSSVYTFQINSNIPIIVMKTASGTVIANNTTVEEAFTISWEDPNYSYIISILKNGVSVPFTNYTELSSRMFKFEESGSYRFTFTNGIGVTYLYSVNANMRPTAIMTAGVDVLKSYDYTNKNVIVTISDRNSNIEVYKLDENNEYKTYTNWQLDKFNFTITEDGTYKIIIANDFSLMNNYYFSIKTSLPTAVVSYEGKEIKNADEVVGVVNIDYNKDEVVDCKLYRNGEVVYGDNSSVSDVGRYTLVLTDKAGNQNTYTFTIKASNDLNWAGIITLVCASLGLIGLVIFFITKFRRPFKLK